MGGWGGWSGWGGWGAQGCQCPNSNFCGQGGQKLKMSPYDGDEVKPDQPRLVKSRPFIMRMDCCVLNKWLNF